MNEDDYYIDCQGHNMRKLVTYFFDRGYSISDINLVSSYRYLVVIADLRQVLCFVGNDFLSPTEKYYEDFIGTNMTLEQIVDSC